MFILFSKENKCWNMNFLWDSSVFFWPILSGMPRLWFKKLSRKTINVSTAFFQVFFCKISILFMALNMFNYVLNCGHMDALFAVLRCSVRAFVYGCDRVQWMKFRSTMTNKRIVSIYATFWLNSFCFLKHHPTKVNKMQWIFSSVIWKQNWILSLV